MTNKKATILGLETRYLETTGNSEIPLIILHGWGSSRDRWREVLGILEKNNITAIVFDLPGFGETRAPQESWSLGDYINFVIKFVENLGFKKFNLLGHSFGGRIAMKLAADNAGKDCRAEIEKLILLDSAGVTPRDKKRLFAYKIATKIVKFIFSLPVLSIFRSITEKTIYWLSGSYDYYLAKGAMKETFKKVIEEDLTFYLSKIRVKTFIIWGSKDKMTPVSDAHIINKGIKDSTLNIIDGGGHSMFINMPGRLAKEILRYL